MFLQLYITEGLFDDVATTVNSRSAWLSPKTAVLRPYSDGRNASLTIQENHDGWIRAPTRQRRRWYWTVFDTNHVVKNFELPTPIIASLRGSFDVLPGSHTGGPHRRRDTPA